MFVSTFYSTRNASGQAFAMPSFNDFAERLTCDQDKHIQMGSFGSNAKSHALVTSSPSNSRIPHKSSSKGKQNQRKKQCNSSNHSPKLDSKGKKGPPKCTFCGK